MISITKQQLDLLISLQEKEQRKSALQAELNRLPEKKTVLESGLDARERDIQETQKKLDALKKDYRARENELELNQSRIKKRRVQLNSVKTNREYQSLLKEIDEIREANSRMEDASLQCLDDIESVEKQLAEKKQSHEASKKQIEEQKQALDETARDLEEKIRQLTLDTEGIVEKLDPGLLKQYRQVKNQCGGVGLVEVENAVCKGCHLNIPPQMYNELHRGNELKMCPHCHRLIYVI
ncbi:MAG: zinc ribbon domain-containing protein [Thermodesulfobacteriota bacterium]